MTELRRADELAAACDDDPLCLWVSRGLLPGSGARAWASASAVLAACPGLSDRDWAAVWGEPAAAARLVAEVLPLIGPGYRLLGHADLVTELARRLAGWLPSAPFGWMNTPANGMPGSPRPDLWRAGQAGGLEGPETIRWLGTGEMPAVDALLDRAFPDSGARPGMAGVRRWAGAGAQDGRLLAVAADAWSAPAVGFMAGVAVSEEARGRGLGGRLCRFVIDDLVARHGRAALMVHGWNDTAIRLYQRLGLVFRPVRAGRPDPARDWGPGRAGRGQAGDEWTNWHLARARALRHNTH